VGGQAGVRPSVLKMAPQGPGLTGDRRRQPAQYLIRSTREEDGGVTLVGEGGDTAGIRTLGGLIWQVGGVWTLGSAMLRGRVVSFLL